MNKQLLNYINDPFNSDTAFNLAEWYYREGQTAAALNFYLRVSEIDDNKELTYESLLKAGLCLKQQGNRLYSTKSFYLHAVSLFPEKAEGHFLLAEIYKDNNEWQECYTHTQIGIACKDLFRLRSNIGYPGVWGLEIIAGIALWNMSRHEECIEKLLELYKRKEISSDWKKTIKDFITYIWGTDKWTEPTYYNKAKELKHTFDNWEIIPKNQSQAFQDIFVLLANNGKIQGKYVEIGSHEPQIHSNTYILEKYFDWKGISFEIDYNMWQKFNGLRENKCYLQDATKCDYDLILSRLGWGYDFDYLQLDCEPPENTFKALLEIPFEKYRFAVITYEHDYYCDESKLYRDRSRRYLKAMGYELIVGNVSVDDNSPFEDWWVHPELVDMDRLNGIKSITDLQNAEKYIINL